MPNWSGGVCSRRQDNEADMFDVSAEARKYFPALLSEVDSLAVNSAGRERVFNQKHRSWYRRNIRKQVSSTRMSII